MQRSANSLVSWVAVVVSLALVAAALTLAWNSGRLNSLICGGTCPASNAIAPKNLRPAIAASRAGRPSTTKSPDIARALRAAQTAARKPALGPRVAIAVTSAEPDSPVESSGTGGFMPASTTKVVTSFAALTALDPQDRVGTTVVREGSQLTLVGGGDPFLTDQREPGDPVVWRAELKTLAKRTASALGSAKGQQGFTLSYDDSLFTGPRLSPGWKSTYVAENVVTPMSALWIDRGMIDPTNPETTPRKADPSLDAATVFARYLAAEGVEVSGAPQPGRAPASGNEVARVNSSTIAQIVEQTIRASDDEAAESLLRLVGHSASEDASFEGGSKATIEILRDAGVNTDGLVLEDGSGLARTNRISAVTLVEVLRAAAGDGRYAAVVDDLPVSGFSGTLTERFAPRAHGLVRAKTGTLTGVHSLAGIALDARGAPIIFAVMADRADPNQPLAARSALDDTAAAITAPG